MLINSSRGDFNGIINYFNELDIPRISINADMENFRSVDNFIHRDSSSFVEYNKEGSDPIHIDFDFVFFRVNVSEYLIETSYVGSPPTEWKLSGSNNRVGPWTTIDSPPFNDTLCPKQTTKTECNVRTISKWRCSSSKSAFRYIRFSMIKDRFNSNTARYLRLGGLEFYGTVHLSREKLCTIYNKVKSYRFVFVFILFTSS